MTEPIARIEAALGGLGAEHEPPVGWEARVLATATTSKRTRPWWWFAIPAVAAAVSAVVIILPSSRGGPLQLTDEVVQRDTTVRGPSRHLGDVVRATATQGGANRVIWVYHNNALIVACPGAAQCRSSGPSTTVEFTLNLLGEYVIVALASQSAIPPPKGTYDLDVAMLRDIAAPEIRPFSVQ